MEQTGRQGAENRAIPDTAQGAPAFWVQNLEKRIRLIEGHFEQMQAVVGRSALYWDGIGADAYRRAYREATEGIVSVLADLRTAVQRLEGDGAGGGPVQQKGI